MWSFPDNLFFFCLVCQPQLLEKKKKKKKKVSSVDGIIFTLIGRYILVETFNNHMLNIFVIVLAIVFTILCVVYNIFKSH